MTTHIRRPPPALAVLGLLAACSSSGPPARAPGQAGLARPVASFEGTFDPATGTIALRAVRALPAGAQAALVELPLLSDGTTGNNPRNTLELRNASPLNAGPGSCGESGATTWDADVTLQSFYTSQTLTNVYVELTSVSPAGHAGCNNAAPMTGVSAANGLWAYGTIAPGASATATWSFRNVTSEAFTFHGRIMAEVGAPVQGSGPEFDWSPSAIVMPESTFVRVATTTAQLAWNGTGWDSWVAAGGTISPQLVGLSGDHVVNLWDPPARYADLSQGYWVADEAHGGNLVDFTGDFTVCAKVKPQPNPDFLGDRRVFVAKGRLGDEGWALYQNLNLYAFTYILNANTQPSAAPVTSSPDLYDYDYICGGRVGDLVHGNAHGRDNGTHITFPGSLADPATLALAIGAFDDGAFRGHGGVYEVIFDSRAADWSVIHEIVDMAEGRRLFPGAGGYTAVYRAAYAEAGTDVVGADGATYRAPAYGTVPLAGDGTGLAPEGSVIEYTHPLAASTVATGFCLGVEVAATGSWDDVLGGLLSYSGGQLRLQLNPSGSPPGPPWLGFVSQGVWFPGADLPTNWAVGSRHTFKACQEPYAAGPLSQVRVYADGVLLRTGQVQSATVMSLDETSSTIQIGGGTSTTTLSRARIGRVFACGGSDAASCN